MYNLEAGTWGRSESILKNVFMAGKNRSLQGVPVPANSAESGRSSGLPRLFSAM